MCRIASYITALTRVNLVNGINIISKELGNTDSIYYCDTDSIYFKLPHNDKTAEEYYIKIKIAL